VTAEPERELGEAVTVAYVHQNHVTYSWYHSMVELLGWDMANQGRILQGGYIGMRHGSDGLVEARNKAIVHFLEEGNADWLFWVDTDMGFPADTIDQLLKAANPVERPIVGALCFTQTEKTEDGMGGWRCRATPTVFDWAKLDDGQMGWVVRWDFPPNTLIQVGGTGGACILIHRSVFERIEQAHGRTWYDRVPNTTTGQLISEDLSFCLRAGALQIPIFVHTGIRTTHMKALWLGDDDYQQQRSSVTPAAPATAETAVLVPVLRRPQNAKPFMTSLRASTGLAHVYAICQGDDPDTAAAWLDAGAEVLESGEQTSFAAKVNLGYAKTSEPWLFLVGDDVRFHPGWLDHAQAIAGDRYHVVGTNDLGNPRVMAGEHATHLLVRRSYVDEVGASWDGPGVVCHEGYYHWFCDDELVAAAKQRGVWAMALASKVEHLHPLWNKAEMDPVYELGERHATTDKQHFLERLAAHLPERQP
jgi:GT2 family glycosyltransferase